ncbi:hypothetical protein GQX73_g10442 [Xylaria multiplex]|uniref:BTB domain-containing protein n=1 Tax=Xylaria multiplex TaxID=323545 RepID=A0A7C8IGK4_9PEZI|nr:hypothetical protein GQX73_g10442 [Xylaria multiplex]
MGNIATKTPAVHIVASAGDEELLRSGMLSDIEVECRGKIWRLHRIILMTRCPFFRTALCDKNNNNNADIHVIDIPNQSPEQVGWAIHFIYTGQVPYDLLALLMDRQTVMNTCLELFALANFFSLGGLRKRTIDVLTEVFIAEASVIQEGILSGRTQEDYLSLFHLRFLDIVRTVYGAGESANMGPLKDTLLLFLKLTNYVVLRDELLGETLRTDPTLAEFLTDILKATLFRPLDPDNENMQATCSQCEKTMEVAVKFADVICGAQQRAWCRECRPLGELNVMKLLGADA